VISDIEPVATRSLASGVRAHRPLFLLAVLMAAVAAVAFVGLLVDDRTVTGIPLWAKPFKFATSIAIYALTFGWLIGQLRRGRRVAWWAGTVAAVFLAVEMVVIVGQALRVTTSHFNNSTPMDKALYDLMAGSIAAVWVATLVISLLLFANPGPDRARNIAVRTGAMISVVGMALGFLMTIPSAAQIEAGGSIVGAHTVGLDDGGPGLPLLGWSTVGGDLRIPHFVGMHALQLLPLLLIVLELLSRRFGVLADAAVRARLMWIAAAGYVAFVALVTWQALRGQSIVHPDALTLLAFAAIALAVGIPSALVLARKARQLHGIGQVTR
jgi:hypothetical protein